MDTRYLQSLVAVIEYGSLAEAARRLDLTPASIAARVRALEEDLGVVLVKRAGRNVRATEAGLKVLERARLVLREMRDLRATAGDDTPLGEFRLGVSTSALTGLMPPVLAGLYRRHPKLAVFVEPGTSSHLYRKVIDGELDAAFIVQPQFSLPKGYAWRLGAAEPLVVLAPAALRDRDAHALMADEPFIRYDRSVWGGRLADRYLRQHAIRPRERLEIDGLMAIASMVREGLGVSLVPDWAPDWLDSLGLSRVALPGVAPVRRMGILWATQTPHAGLAEAFVQEAEHVLGRSRKSQATP
ncbi:HTH-type transcriptional regulator YofA [compost metagenome]|jgi:DNA-binding transcriptional LysR family regulator